MRIPAFSKADWMLIGEEAGPICPLTSVVFHVAAYSGERLDAIF
jgi:hypothetical protein